MHCKQVPKRLWDYGLKCVSEVRVRTSSDATDLKGRTPLERITGDTVDISEYLDFGFYDCCWYHENAGLGPTKLGRWLGVAHKVGDLMSYWVLTINCTVITRMTVQRVTSLEMQATHMKRGHKPWTRLRKLRSKIANTQYWRAVRHNPMIGMITHLRRTQTLLRNSMR